MRRLLLVMICALLAVSVGTTAIAHAVESQVCVEQANDAGLTHGGDTGDAGDSSDRSGKALPDHQLNCHGHQIAAIGNGDRVRRPDVPEVAPIASPVKSLRSASSHPGLRPPRA